MRYVLIPLSALALLAACASSQQAGVEPAASPVIVTESVPATVPPAGLSPVPAETDNASAHAVADATPVNTVPSLVQAQALDPFQCMMSWTRGAQDALMPWANTVQACEPYAARRRAAIR